MRKTKRKDSRPVCLCSAYKFPHRIGGKCTGSAFVEFYHTYVRTSCNGCNCNSNNGCDVANGSESINNAECYQEAQHYNPGEVLPIKLEDIIPNHPH